MLRRKGEVSEANNERELKSLYEDLGQNLVRDLKGK